MSKEAMKLALEALENWVEYFPQNVDDIDKKAITSMREELSKPDFWEGYVPEPVKPAQQELTNIERHERNVQKFLGEQPAQQEPYCYTYTENGEEYFAPPKAYVPDDAMPLYTSPPAQRTWVGLDQLEIDAWFLDSTALTLEAGRKIAQAIEAKLKEKNT